MAIITCDLETFYDNVYSLKRMSEVDYILDPRFQIIMMAVKVDDQPSEVHVGHAAVKQVLGQVDWSRNALLCHNTRFDGAVLAWHFDVRPALYLDTLSMARATTHWEIGSSSLKAVAKKLALPPKGTEVEAAEGKRLEDFSPAELRAYAEYCRNDNDLCKEIFNRLRPDIPTSELRLIDLFLRMFIEPQVQLDADTLTQYLHQIQTEREQALKRASMLPEVTSMVNAGRTKHVTDPAVLLKSVFSSNPKFAKLLQAFNVAVPMKISPTTGQEIPALARNDREFKELCANPNQPLDVQAVLAARLGAKSTLEETRTEKLLGLARRRWPNGSVGHAPIPVRHYAERSGIPSVSSSWAPVPIKYYGARTGRPSGDSGINWLNFKRGASVREGIVAPPGYRIVHRDASQIEARMVAWLAGCKTLTDAFAEQRDVYCEFASKIYKRTVTKADTLERFIGKTCILGLGYGCGNERFRHMLFIGNGGLSHSIDIDEAQRIVTTYRKEYYEIERLWRACDDMIKILADPRRANNNTPNHNAFQVMVEGEPAPVATENPSKTEIPKTRLQQVVTPQEKPIGLVLPNNMLIAYPGLRIVRDASKDQEQIYYDSPYGAEVKIYGAKCIENISQALARIVVTDIVVRVYRDTGRHPFLTTYDSLDYCVPENMVRDWDARLEYEFSLRPAWAPELPLASEGGWGYSLLVAENEHHESHNK